MKILPNQKIIWYYFEIVHIFAIFGLHLLSRKFRPLGIFDNWRKQCLSSWVPCAPQKGPMRTKNPPFLLSKYFYPNISIQIFLYNFWKREASNGVCLLQMIPICVRFSGQPPTSHPYILHGRFHLWGGWCLSLAQAGHQYGNVRWSDVLFSAKLWQQHCGFGDDHDRDVDDGGDAGHNADGNEHLGIYMSDWLSLTKPVKHIIGNCFYFASFTIIIMSGGRSFQNRGIRSILELARSFCASCPKITVDNRSPSLSSSSQSSPWSSSSSTFAPSCMAKICRRDRARLKSGWVENVLVLPPIHPNPNPRGHLWPPPPSFLTLPPLTAIS